jgi:hypothetical protein
MEKVNRPTEVEHGCEVDARKPWKAPAVEELLVSEAENTLTFGSADNGIYTS